MQLSILGYHRDLKSLFDHNLYYSIFRNRLRKLGEDVTEKRSIQLIG